MVPQSSWRRIRIAESLAAREFRQNAFVYLFPLPFFLLPLAGILFHGRLAVLGAKPSLAVLAAAAVLAMVYGQQGLAVESDRQTLDFLLAKPIPPANLATVKYLINIGIYGVWTVLFLLVLRLNLPTLSVPAMAIGSWTVFALFTLVGMSFLSGLITRGAERLLITVLLTAGFAGICYALWYRVLTLLGARYFWPDIPPPVANLVYVVLPLALAACVLLAPPVVVFWYLRGRPSLLRFVPVWRLLVIWGVLLFVIEGTRATLGPAVWPLPRDFAVGGTGDWHPRAGMVLAGPLVGNSVDHLSVARLGGHAHEVFQGGRIYSPRWSPDGRSIAFVDDRWIMIRQGRSAKRLARGEFPSWSADGQSLAYAETNGKHEAQAVYQVSIQTGRKRVLWEGATKPLGLTWDSARKHLYLLERDGTLRDIDLRTRKAISLSLPIPIKFAVQNPWSTVGSDGLLYLTVTYLHEAHIFTYRPGAAELTPFDDCAGRASPLLPTFVSPAVKGYLWPRVDLAYEYRGFPDEDVEHGHEDEGD